MQRSISVLAGVVLIGLGLLALLFGRAPSQHEHVLAAPQGGPYEDILPAFRPEGEDEFFFEIWSGWSFTVTGYITVYTGVEVDSENIVGFVPLVLSPLSTTTIPIADVPGVPVGFEGFAQVWTDRIVDSNAYATSGRYHIIALNQMTFGPPPVLSSAEPAIFSGVNGAGEPYSITIQAGDTVSWVNSRYSAFNHNVQADDDSFTSGAPSVTWRIFSHTFAASGSNPYHCETHGGAGGVGMAGIVKVVGDAPSLDKSVYLPMIWQEEE